MVSDCRGDLLVREIAFSAETEEVKALTSSYLHNERKIASRKRQADSR